MDTKTRLLLLPGTVVVPKGPGALAGADPFTRLVVTRVDPFDKRTVELAVLNGGAGVWRDVDPADLTVVTV